MKEIMLSVHPKRINRILYGDTSVEIRKTRPMKLATPFKCYIYMSSGGWEWRDIWCTAVLPPNGEMYNGSQHVVGEFVCDNIEWFAPAFGSEDVKEIMKASKMSHDEMLDYLLIKDDKSPFTRYKPFYAWHISNPIIYDKPKNLSDFTVLKRCDACKGGYESSACANDNTCEVLTKLNRVPPSWCYVVSNTI